MKKKLTNKIVFKFESSNKYDKLTLLKIRYGFECLYTITTKLIGITVLAFLFGILKEMYLFILCYLPLRIWGFGFHASTNLQCWISSIIIFIGVPYILNTVELNYNIVVITSIISLILLLIFAPADTKKRPLINIKKKVANKVITFIIAIVYLVLIILLKENYVVNYIFGGLVWEAICVTPILYYIFKQPYNNYKNYTPNYQLRCNE